MPIVENDMFPDPTTPAAPRQGVDRRIDLLVADDNRDICELIVQALAPEGQFQVHLAHSQTEALALLPRLNVEVVLTDLQLGDGDGLEVIRRAQWHVPDAVAVLITGFPTVSSAVSAMKMGACDYLIKPFRVDLLRAVVRRAVERQRLARENMQLREQLAVARLMRETASLQTLQDVLGAALAVVVDELRARAAAIILKSENGESYQLADRRGRGSNQAEEDFLDGEDGLTDRAINTGHPALTTSRQFSMIDGDTWMRVTSFISYPLIAKGRTFGTLNIIRQGLSADPQRGMLRTMGLIAAQTATSIENVRLYQNLHTAYLDTISALANAIEIRDPTTSGHTDRVKLLAQLVARYLGWDDDRLFDLWMGCVLHDIGKIGVPDSILNKPGRLTAEEIETMRRHPVIGARIVVGIPFLRPAIPCILYHHERYDGQGYPYGLSGEAIPIEGRLLAVVDTFDAVLSDRPYRPGRDIDAAIRELRENAGSQFDPGIVEIVAQLVRQQELEWLYPSKKSLSGAAAAGEDGPQLPILEEVSVISS